MPIINATQALDQLKKEVQNARVVAIAEAATKGACQIEERIFDRGQNMDAKSKRTPGYSPNYARLRSNEGLQIAFVDYERTGQLRDEFDLEILSSGAAILTIQGQRARISRFLEQKRGPAFTPDKRDIELMQAVLLQKLASALTYKTPALSSRG